MRTRNRTLNGNRRSGRNGGDTRSHTSRNNRGNRTERRRCDRQPGPHVLEGGGPGCRVPPCATDGTPQLNRSGSTAGSWQPAPGQPPWNLRGVDSTNNNHCSARHNRRARHNRTDSSQTRLHHGDRPEDGEDGEDGGWGDELRNPGAAVCLYRVLASSLSPSSLLPPSSLSSS
ncbi:unnamed protein product [Lampetra fluviatilis]